MADRVITAEAIITAKDATGDVFAKIAGKFQALGKGAKVSADIERMGKTLEQANSQLRALEKLQSSRTGFGDARAKFQAQKVAVEQVAKAMRDAEKPTRALQAAYKSAQTDVTRAAAAFERSKSAMLDAKHAAEGFGAPLARIASEQSRLRSVIDSTTKAIEHQASAEIRAAAAHSKAEKAAEKRAEGIAHHGFGNYVAGAAAGVVGVHGVMRFAEAGIESGAERQHVIAGMKNAGMPDEEISRAQKRAIEVSRSASNLSVTELMELHKEARSAVQHPEEVFELMPDLAKATSVLKGMGAENVNVADIMKGGESLGLMSDPARFHRYLEGQVKAMAVMGKTITTEQIYEAAKYSKSAGATLSDDFINLTMPSLIQEMHGSSAGDALSALTKRWRGGLNHQHLAVERLNSMGLLEDPSQIKRSKSGEILGYGGKLKGDDLLGSDPGKFFQQIWEPAAEASGAKSFGDKVKLLNETLPSTAANLGRILIQQEETLKQHRANYEAAPGLDQAVENQKSDPTVGLNALKASLNDLGAAASDPILGVAAKGLSALSGSLKELAAAAGDHPVLAAGAGAAGVMGGLAGAGYLSYQLMNGFGLGASATALDGSAAALTEAAVALGAKGIIPGAASAAGAGAITLGGLAAAAAPLVLATGAAVAAGTLDKKLMDGAQIPADNPRNLPDIQSQTWSQFLRGDVPGMPKPEHINDPWLSGERQAIERRSELAANAFRRDPEAARGDAFGRIGSSGPIDVTGKVQADVKTDVDVRFKLDVPPGFGVTKEFQGVVTRVDSGTSMPGARAASNGRVAGPN